MYFTREKNESREAIYSGRFAFLPCRKANSLSDSELYGKYNEAMSSDAVYNDISEEFYHSRQISRSICGLSLNGLRWLTRVYWLLSGKKLLIRKYYLMRSIFYCFSYDLLERDAERKEKSINNNKKNISFLRTLKMDFFILNEFSRSLNYLFFSFYLLAVPFLFIIGYVITKHFTIKVKLINSKGEISSHYISNRSYISSVTDDTVKDGLYWKIGTYIQPEYWALKLRGEVSFEDWVMEKFASEYIFYKLFYSKIIDRNLKRNINMDLFSKRYGSYNSYLCDIIDFSAACSCCYEIKDINTVLLTYKLKKILMIDSGSNLSHDEVFFLLKKRYKELIDENLSLEREIYDIFHLFYQHGN